jgi:predicted RNA-binding protein with RPS1 domain
LTSVFVRGSLDDDESPKAGDTVQGYVIGTNKKGCFVRLARHVEGRSTLKELCDGFLPNPEASFPMGRLVVGKVKEVRAAPKKSKNSKDPVKIQVDLDMRESTLLENKKKLTFDDIELQGKYKGTVTRIETYGLFVQIENSNVSGLTHLSECSDKCVKNLQALHDPGDLVKVLYGHQKKMKGRNLALAPPLNRSSSREGPNSATPNVATTTTSLLSARGRSLVGWTHAPTYMDLHCTIHKQRNVDPGDSIVTGKRY